MMSINPFSAGQSSQASHFPHYGAPSAYTYPSTISGRASAAEPYHPDGEVDARLRESGSQASYLPPHIPHHLSPHISPHRSPSSTPHHHAPYPPVFAQEYSSMIDKRSKSMTSEAPLSAVQKARKVSSPALSRRRKRSDSGDAHSSDKDEAGASANVTMFQCRGFGDCQMVFTRSEHLARHVRKHTGERPFQCHCGKAFSRLDNLRQHAQTVHAEEQERNELMMQELTSLHSSLAASAAQAQVAHAQVLGKAGPNISASFVPMSSGPSAVPARRKSSMTAAKTSSAPTNKKRASLASTPRRDSIISQSSAPPRSNDEAYFADQKEASPASSAYYHSYPEVPMALAPSNASTTMSNGQSSLLPNGEDHSFQYARPPSSAGAYSTFAHSNFGHGAIPPGSAPQEAPYYAHYDHSAVYTGMAPTSSHATSTPAPFSHLVVASAPSEYSTYPAPLSHPYQHQPETSEWKTHEVGPRGEEHYHTENGAAKSSSNFQSTLSAHLAMRAPILRPGRGVSPPPSTSHSLRPTSSSSIGPMDRPVLPPLSSLSRPGTGHSNITGPRSGLLEASPISFLFRPSSSDDKRPYTSPAEPHLANNRPVLPSVRTTSAIRPDSRGSVLDPPSLFETRKNRMASQLPSEARRGASSASREFTVDRLKASPPASHSVFRFQPPPLHGQGAGMQQGLTSLYRPISRDRPLTGSLPSLSTTLDSLKRTRELRGREEEHASKRLRPFTSGDLPPPSSFGSTSDAGEDRGKVAKQEEDDCYTEVSGDARRVSIASLVDAHDEPPTSAKAPSPMVTMKKEQVDESN